MNQYTDPKPVTARVERRCTNTTWHPGCSRWIKVDEQCYRVNAGSISDDFVVCAGCYAKHKVRKK